MLKIIYWAIAILIFIFVYKALFSDGFIEEEVSGIYRSMDIPISEEGLTIIIQLIIGMISIAWPLFILILLVIILDVSKES